MIFPIKVLADLGFEILATQGTAEVLRRNGVARHRRAQALRGRRPERRADHRAADPGRRDRPRGQHPARLVRAAARRASTATRSAPPRCWPNIPCITTVQGLGAAVQGIEALSRGDIGVRSLQDWAALALHGGCGRVTPYRAALRPRPDPGRPRAGAPRRASRAIRGRPARAARGVARPRPAPGRARWGSTSRPCSGLAAGFDKNAVGIDALGRARLRLRRGRHGHRRAAAGQPAAAAVPAARRPGGRQPDGLQQRRRRGGGRAARARRRRAAAPATGGRSASTSARPRSSPRTTARSADYAKCAGLLAPYADYLVVNVSSPNTPGLRDLQAVEKLEPLLAAVRRRADEPSPTDRVPLLVKIAPDLADDDVLAVADLAARVGLDGIIATNTTISRDGLRTPAAEVERAGAGGLSGAPLGDRSLEVLRLLRDRVGDEPHAGRRRRHRDRRGRPRAARGRCRPCCRPTPRSSTRAALAARVTARSPTAAARTHRRRRRHDEGDRTTDLRRPTPDAIDDRGRLCVGIDPHRRAARRVGAHRLRRRAWRSSR